MKFNIKVNLENELIYPDLHDAEILRFDLQNFLEDQILNIDLKTESGEEIILQFLNIRHFICHSISSQNILREVRILEGKSFSDEYKSYEHLFKNVEKLENSFYPSSPKKLIHFQSSVGADIIVVCDEINIL